MQRGYPVRGRQAVIANLPLIGQLCHREQLVFDSAKIARLDLMVSADASRRQTSGPNPAADRLRVPADLLGGFSDRQHLEDCRRGCGLLRTRQASSVGRRSRPLVYRWRTYPNVRRQSQKPAPASQVSHPSNQYRPCPCGCFARRSYSSAMAVTLRPGISSKWRVLVVPTHQPTDTAVAATIRSCAPTSVPDAVRPAHILAWVRAASRSNGREGNAASTASTKASRRPRCSLLALCTPCRARML